MWPDIYFRVEDDESRARYYDEEGLFAEDIHTEVDFDNRGRELYSQVKRHLDWGNRVPTPFISMYCHKGVALREANRRRANDRKKNVRVYKIDIRESDEHMEFRKVRNLAERLQLRIPESAWNNSEYEYIFLRYVPDSAVVDCFEPKHRSC